MKMYKWFRGLLKGSAILSIMFVMQACYGAPHQMDDPYFNNEEEAYQPTDTVQNLEQAVPLEAEAE